MFRIELLKMIIKVFCNVLVLITYIQATVNKSFPLRSDLNSNDLQHSNTYNKNIVYKNFINKDFFSKQIYNLSNPITSTTIPIIDRKTGNNNSKVLRNYVFIKDDGTYQFCFETSNGIKRSELSNTNGHMQGTSLYISPEGVSIHTSYVADENGYHPIGDHIPKIPEHVLKALEYIRTHPYIEKDYYTGEYKTPRPPTIPTLKYIQTTSSL